MRPDAELVYAVLDGERAAFEVLVKRYERPARAVALDVLGNPADAQDAPQDAFIRAYESLPSLRKASAFGPWLMIITRRCALGTACRRQRETPLDAIETFTIESSDGRLDEQKQRLLAAVAKLPESEKHLIMLRYFCRHSVKDVAEIVGRSIGTVTKQLSRAHKRLRKTLKEAQL